jgi:hypothetical protein
MVTCACAVPGTAMAAANKQQISKPDHFRPMDLVYLLMLLERPMNCSTDFFGMEMPNGALSDRGYGSVKQKVPSTNGVLHSAELR